MTSKDRNVLFHLVNDTVFLNNYHISLSPQYLPDPVAKNTANQARKLGQLQAMVGNGPGGHSFR